MTFIQINFVLFLFFCNFLMYKIVSKKISDFVQKNKKKKKKKRRLAIRDKNVAVCCVSSDESDQWLTAVFVGTVTVLYNYNRHQPNFGFYQFSTPTYSLYRSHFEPHMTFFFIFKG